MDALETSNEDLRSLHAELEAAQVLHAQALRIAAMTAAADQPDDSVEPANGGCNAEFVVNFSNNPNEVKRVEHCKETGAEGP